MDPLTSILSTCSILLLLVWSSLMAASTTQELPIDREEGVVRTGGSNRDKRSRQQLGTDQFTYSKVNNKYTVL